MKRRNLLKTGAGGLVVSTAGCIEPINNLIGNNDGNNESETPNYFDLMPSASLNEENGVFGIHVNISDLRENYSDPLIDPYSPYDVSSNPITLLTGSAILSIDPIISSNFSDHKMEDVALAATGLESNNTDQEFEEYILVDNHLLIKGSFDSDYLTDTVGYEDQGDGEFGIEDTVKLIDDWLVIPFDGDLESFNTEYESDGSLEDSYSDLFSSESVGDGSVNVFDLGTDVEIDDINFDFDSVVSSAYFGEDGLQTKTLMSTSSDLSGQTDSLNETFNSSSSFNTETNVLVLTSNWES